jgi:hypothetical protein
MLPNCPVCKTSKSVRNSHGRAIDTLWRLIGLYPYRCDACSTRFHRFGRSGEDVSNAH